MSVATRLGVDDPDEGLLAQARDRWARWGQDDPDLAVVADLLELPEWVQARTGPQAPLPALVEADAVLRRLARLASPRGGDDVAAAAALAYLLVPGASLLAHRLEGYSPHIDHYVAGQLWLEIRSFPWERLSKVAANVLLRTRRAVIRDLRGDALTPVDPTEATWQLLETRPRPHAEDAYRRAQASWRVRTVLEQAVAQNVITEKDRALLTALAEAATEHGVSRAGRGFGGLCSIPALETVAAQSGCSLSTVRRRARESLDAVAAAYGYLQKAS